MLSRAIWRATKKIIQNVTRALATYVVCECSYDSNNTRLRQPLSHTGYIGDSIGVRELLQREAAEEIL
jgi:hypothetical protein